MRTKQEIKNIDNDLDLFDLNDWCFEEHYKDNDDFYDISFDSNGISMGLKRFVLDLPLVIYILLFIGLFLFILGIAITKLIPDKNYETLVGLDNMMQRNEKVAYVEGSLCDDNVIIEASSLCSDYFNVLNSESSYNYLDTLCLNKSDFNTVYQNYVSNMNYSYDINDCYARLLRYFGSYCRLNKIQKVIYKDGTYYCYMAMTVPSQDDIQGYIRLYSYNFTKHFTITDINEGNIVRYLYSMEGVSKIPCSEKIVCIELKKDTNGKLKISDDSSITNICTDAYIEALNEVANLLGTSLRIGK